MILELKPHTKVTCTDNVKSALKLSHYFDFDLIICDFHLPDGTAIAVCQANLLRPSVIMTADPQGDLIAEAIFPGGAIYLPKPFNHLQFWDAVNRAMRSGGHAEERILLWLERRRTRRQGSV